MEIKKKALWVAVFLLLTIGLTACGGHKFEAEEGFREERTEESGKPVVPLEKKAELAAEGAEGSQKPDSTGLSEEVAATEKPEYTKVPTVTEMPVVTVEPSVTEGPTYTKAPVHTKKPTEKEEPKYTKEPTVTQPPADTQLPVVTKVPRETFEPVVTPAPQRTMAPEKTKAPENTNPPEKTASPQASTKPQENPGEQEHVHEFEKSVWELPTCQKGGYYNLVCKICGHVECVTQEPLAHEVEDIVIQEGNCMEDTIIRHKCKICEVQVKSDTRYTVYDKHDWIKVTLEEGEVEECSRCGVVR